MNLTDFNQLNETEAKQALTKCCGATNWVNNMMMHSPFNSKEHVLATARDCWDDCKADDWKEAFTHHPKIGDLKSLKKKYASTSAWAANEQAAVATAKSKVLHELAKGNMAYENKFGYIFIVCATGKSAKEMLDLLRSRIHNAPKQELLIAKEEQHKITEIRINKLLE